MHDGLSKVLLARSACSALPRQWLARCRLREHHVIDIAKNAASAASFGVASKTRSMGGFVGPFVARTRFGRAGAYLRGMLASWNGAVGTGRRFMCEAIGAMAASMVVVALTSPTGANAGPTQMRLPASLVQPDLILRSAAARLAPGCEREVPVAIVTIEGANTGNGPSGAIAGAASYSVDGAANFTPTHPSESLAAIAAGASRRTRCR